MKKSRECVLAGEFPLLVRFSINNQFYYFFLIDFPFLCNIQFDIFFKLNIQMYSFFFSFPLNISFIYFKNIFNLSSAQLSILSNFHWKHSDFRILLFSRAICISVVRNILAHTFNIIATINIKENFLSVHACVCVLLTMTIAKIYTDLNKSRTTGKCTGVNTHNVLIFLF